MASVREDAYPRASLRPDPRATRGRRRSARAVAIVAAGVALADLTLVAFGCGGSSGAKVAQVGTTSTPAGSLTGQGGVVRQDQLLAFATCMRSRGVPSFPDPQVVNGHINMPATAQHFDASSPIATAAMAACRSKLGRSPGRGAEKLVQGAVGQAAGGPAGGKGK
jgi:hypothetical protein